MLRTTHYCLKPIAWQRSVWGPRNKYAFRSANSISHIQIEHLIMVRVRYSLWLAVAYLTQIASLPSYWSYGGLLSVQHNFSIIAPQQHTVLTSWRYGGVCPISFRSFCFVCNEMSAVSALKKYRLPLTTITVIRSPYAMRRISMLMPEKIALSMIAYGEQALLLPMARRSLATHS